MVDSPPTPRRRLDAFVLALVGIAIVGFGIRTIAALRRAPPSFLSDPNYYRVQGRLLADGHGFAEPFTFLTQHRLVPTAFHPPLYSLFFGALSWVGWDSLSAERIASCALGSITIVIVGLIGREIRNARVGVIAAVIAALSPNLWVPDGTLMSEGMGALMVAVALWFAYRLLRRPGYPNAIGLGAAIGLAALTRPESLAFSVLLVVPVVLSVALPGRRRAALFVVAAITTGIVVGPWLVRSLTIFDRPVLFSTNSQAVIGVANCPSTYSGPDRGSWSFRCTSENARVYPTHTPTGADESVSSANLGRQGTRFLLAHKGQFLTQVIWERIGTTWSVYRPFKLSAAASNELKTRTEMTIGVWALWISLGFGVVGATSLYKSRSALLWPLLAPAVVATIVSVTAFGTPRFRVLVEPSIAILAAVGIDALLRFRARQHAEAAARVRPDADNALESVSPSS
jgi:4-amino-4-deoxy-L-arabinose transferase and related glycosyltransferases of PMT family